VTRAIQAGPHDQATRCRGNVEGLHTLVPAAGALAASGHPVRVNDGEHPRQRVQNEPIVESAWHLTGVVETAELLGLVCPRGRLDRTRRPKTLSRCVAPRLLRSAGEADLCGPRRPLDQPPPRSTRFGSPLVLSRVHWVRPELVAEVKFLTWTADNLLRQVVYQGLREDKLAREVRREIPYPKPVSGDKGGARRKLHHR
jgi:ATP dependent DNA ligase C terminal region